MNEVVRLAELDSPLGTLAAAATSDAVVLLEYAAPERLGQQLAGLRQHFGERIETGRKNPLLRQLARELDEYFAGERRRFEVPLRYPGTPFQRRVWERLLALRFGETCSYQQLASDIGAPRACRAVGSANGANRIAIVIPCHRVVNTTGALGGYGGELWRKRWLLAHESRADFHLE